MVAGRAAPLPPSTSTSMSSKADITKGMVTGSRSSTTDHRRIMNINKRRLEEQQQLPASLPPRPQMVSIKGASSTAMNSANTNARPDRPHVSATTTASEPRSNGQVSQIADDQPRAAKRAKKGGGEDRVVQVQVPSLLSRIQSNGSTNNNNNNNNNSNASGDRKTLSSHQNRQSDAATAAATTTSPSSTAQRRNVPTSDNDRDPVVGFSIRGAAKAANRPSSHGGGEEQQRAAPASLLDRMQADRQQHHSGGESGSRRGRRRTRNW